MSIRRLTPDDESDVEDFLRDQLESSMFLLHNVSRGGLTYQGNRHQAEYFGVFRGNTLLGLAAHTWLDTLVLQCPSLEALEALEKHLPRLISRPIKGVLGPRDQCVELMDRLSLDRSNASLDQDEPLYRLELARMRCPAALQDPTLIVRPPRPDEHLLLSRWRLLWLQEIMLYRPSEALDRRAAHETLLAIEEQRAFVLENRPVDGPPELVSWCCFNAVCDGAVQLSGLWTPHTLRGRHFGQVAAAGALLHARDVLGAKIATVLLDEGNRPALACCEALRFERVGRFSFTLWG